MKRSIKSVNPEKEIRQNNPHPSMSPEPPPKGGQLNEGQSPRPSPQPKPADPQKKR